MITRVLDSKGRVLHDCTEAGCENSWDGYNIATGEPVEGRADHPDSYVAVDERTVKARDE